MLLNLISLYGSSSLDPNEAIFANFSPVVNTILSVAPLNNNSVIAEKKQEKGKSKYEEETNMHDICICSRSLCISLLSVEIFQCNCVTHIKIYLAAFAQVSQNTGKWVPLFTNPKASCLHVHQSQACIHKTS